LYLTNLFITITHAQTTLFAKGKARRAIGKEVYTMENVRLSYFQKKKGNINITATVTGLTSAVLPLKQ
jgi:hypothetical protein